MEMWELARWMGGSAWRVSPRLNVCEAVSLTAPLQTPPLRTKGTSPRVVLVASLQVPTNGTRQAPSTGNTIPPSYTSN